MVSKRQAETSGWKPLVDAIEASRNAMGDHRRLRRRTIESYAKPTVERNDDGEVRSPVNMLELLVNVYRRYLSATNPAVNVVARMEELQPLANDFGAHITHVLDEIRFGESHEDVVVDAMFGLGCMKVGLTTGDAVELMGALHDAGQPFADPVDFDDLVLDMGVKRFEQMRYCGDRYVVPWEMAGDLGLFDRPVNRPRTRIERNNEDGEIRVAALGLDDSDEDMLESYMPMVELFDIYLQFEGKILTFVCKDGQDLDPKPVRSRDWEGPENGPYHFLRFGRIPSSLLPLAPAPLMKDLHDLMNVVFSKLGRQAARQKTVTIATQGGGADAKRVKDAADGEIILVANAQGTREARYGGVDAPNLAFLLQLRDIFAYQGGNLDALGGLSPQAETLGQEELLKQGSSMRVVDMQKRTVEFTSRIVRDIGYWVWNNPSSTYVVDKAIPGTPYTIPAQVTPEMREENDYVDFNLRIEPFSMVVRSPSERLATITQTFERFLLPLAPLMAQQGMSLDIADLVAILAKYTDTPEILRMVQAVDPAAASALAQGEGSDMQAPPSTASAPPRDTFRRTIPGSSRSGKDDVMSRILMGANAQPSEKAAIGRPTG